MTGADASYTLSVFWVVGGALEAFSTQACMLLWMKAAGYDREQNVTFPLGVTAVGIVATLLTSVGIDASGKHMPWGFAACALQLAACAMLIVPGLPDGAVFAAYCECLLCVPPRLPATGRQAGERGERGERGDGDGRRGLTPDIAGSAYMIQPVCFTWANKILLRTGDEAARAVTLYAMNGASSVLFAFWGIVLYPAPDAPGLFRKGTIAMFVVAGVLAAWICVVAYVERWVARRVPPPLEPESELAVEVDVGTEGKESDVSLAKA